MTTPAPVTGRVATAPAPGGRGRESALRHRFTLPGAWGALILACLSLTPSLLPRSGLTQGLVTGISAAIGYGLGVLAAYCWREIADRGPRPARARSWQVFGAVALVAVAVMGVLGLRWQRSLAALMGAPTQPLWSALVVLVVALAVLLGLVGIGRGVRRAFRWLTRLFGRWIGARAARVLGWGVVAVAVFLLVTGVLFDGFLALADRAFAVRDVGTEEGVTPPAGPGRSGGPESLVPWDTLGVQGRTFTAGGPTGTQIAAFTGAAAPEPIRVFAGIASAEDVEARARLVVDDLVRAGGFERSTLLVATTTGTGWLDPGSIAAFEYLAGGDSAVAAMQYSYLPSWISFLTDRVRAREAGRALFDAVYERWSALPAADRPALHVAGESLGAFGAEAAFSGEYDLRNRTAGALLTGPPDFAVLRTEFTAGRDAASPEVEPVYRGGRTVRFSNEIGSGAPPVGVPWDGTRILYLAHPSDPIARWSPDLLLTRPDWLEEPPGRDMLDAVVWIPFVTFWQVSADLPFAVGVPDGHGHRYTAEAVDAWAIVLRPPDWTPERADRLRALLAVP